MPHSMLVVWWEGSLTAAKVHLYILIPVQV